MNPSNEPQDPDTTLVTLRNGVRVVVVRLPHLATAAVSVFVRVGSQHESARCNGISHVIEHMAFKGTVTRDCQKVNLDAERLGAEVDAYTDKDRTTFHMRGFRDDACTFVGMLGDIVRNSTFPDEELERERAVLVQEHEEYEADDMDVTFALFDRTCYGEHPAGNPVIGTRANLQRFTRAHIVDWVRQHYTGANTIVAAAGDLDPRAIVEAAETAFGDMPRGTENAMDPPAFVGGIRSRHLPGSTQIHAVVGFPIPGLAGQHQAFVVAAALLGEGMSSPLLDEVRERRGLVYHADCYAHVRDVGGEVVIEASTMPAHLHEYLAEVTRLLHQHREATDPVGFQRARNQIRVQTLLAREMPAQRLELAALDLFALGRLRTHGEILAGLEAIDPAQVRLAFARMLERGPAVAIAGRLGRGDKARLAAWL